MTDPAPEPTAPADVPGPTIVLTEVPLKALDVTRITGLHEGDEPAYRVLVPADTKRNVLVSVLNHLSLFEMREALEALKPVNRKAAHTDAEETLAESLRVLRDAGVEVTGEITEDDPLPTLRDRGRPDPGRRGHHRHRTARGAGHLPHRLGQRGPRTARACRSCTSTRGLAPRLSVATIAGAGSNLAAHTRQAVNSDAVSGLVQAPEQAWAASRIRNGSRGGPAPAHLLSPGSPREARDGRESVPTAGGKCRGERHDREPSTHPSAGVGGDGSGHHQGVPDRHRPAGQDRRNDVRRTGCPRSTSWSARVARTRSARPRPRP